MVLLYFKIVQNYIEQTPLQSQMESDNSKVSCHATSTDIMVGTWIQSDDST